MRSWEERSVSVMPRSDCAARTSTTVKALATVRESAAARIDAAGVPARVGPVWKRVSVDDIQSPGPSQ
jgi:hypothetical protein